MNLENPLHQRIYLDGTERRANKCNTGIGTGVVAQINANEFDRVYDLMRDRKHAGFPDHTSQSPIVADVIDPAPRIAD